MQFMILLIEIQFILIVVVVGTIKHVFECLFLVFCQLLTLHLQIDIDRVYYLCTELLMHYMVYVLTL